MSSIFPILVSPLPSAPWHLRHNSVHVAFASAAWPTSAELQTSMTAKDRFFISLCCWFWGSESAPFVKAVAASNYQYQQYWRNELLLDWPRLSIFCRAVAHPWFFC